MTSSVLVVSRHPSRHVIHVETERSAQIVARLLAERCPGMTFSYAEGVDLRHGDCHPSVRDCATSFEVRRLMEAELVVEAAANPAGLPKWCAFQYRNRGVNAYRDHDLRRIELCRRDFETVQERAIYARDPSPDDVLERFRMVDCHTDETA